MKKCLIMFGLFVLALIMAMVTGLSEEETLNRQMIVEVHPNGSDLLSDVKDY